MSDRPSRHELVNRLLSGSAGVVAVCALAVSAYQAYLAREQQRMGVWRRLDLPMSTGGTIYARKVRNVGLGPALVRSVVVTVDQRPVQTWDDALRALVGDSTLRAMRADTTLRAVEVNTVARGTVVLPGALVDHVRFEGGTVPGRIYRASRGRLRTAVCYCSLYEDCWTVANGDQDPTPVRACPAAADSTREFRM